MTASEHASSSCLLRDAMCDASDIPVKTIIEDGRSVPHNGKLVEIDDSGCRIE